MQYLSPFHILSDFSTGRKYDEEEVRKAKKRILSEFELTGGTTIVLGNQEMDKDSVLKFFDKLTSESIDFHSKIYNDKLLLHFLEYRDLEIFYQEQLLEEYQEDSKFLHFIAPYFNYQYNLLLFEAVRKQDIPTLQTVLEVDYPLPAVYKGEAYKNTYRYIRGKTQDLGDLTEKSKSSHIYGAEILPFFNPNFIKIFNLLPDYFDAVRNEYADYVDTLAVELHNKARRTSLAIDILESAMSLKIRKDVWNRLDYVLQQLKPAHQQYSKWAQPNTNTKTQTNFIWIIQIIIMLVFLMYLIMSRSGPTYSSSFDDYKSSDFFKSYSQDYMDKILESTISFEQQNQDSILNDIRTKLDKLNGMQEKWKELIEADSIN